MLFISLCVQEIILVSAVFFGGYKTVWWDSALNSSVGEDAKEQALVESYPLGWYGAVDPCYCPPWVQFGQFCLGYAFIVWL